MIFPIFSNYIPKWRCSPTEKFSKDCDIYLACNDTIEFENEYFYSSAMQFNWVCGAESYLVAFYSQMQFIGVLIGTVTFGWLSDHFGRRPIALMVLTIGIFVCGLSGESKLVHLMKV